MKIMNARKPRWQMSETAKKALKKNFCKLQSLDNHHVYKKLFEFNILPVFCGKSKRFQCLM